MPKNPSGASTISSGTVKGATGGNSDKSFRNEVSKVRTVNDKKHKRTGSNKNPSGFTH